MQTQYRLAIKRNKNTFVSDVVKIMACLRYNKQLRSLIIQFLRRRYDLICAHNTQRMYRKYQQPYQTIAELVEFSANS